MAEFKTVAKVSEVGPGQLKHIELDDGTQVCLANVGATMGEAKDPPPDDPEPTYEVRVEGDEVQVAIGPDSEASS